jgi:hypothetical protein
MMPWQLREGLKRRVKGAPPRPIVENLPAMAVHQLPVPAVNDSKTYTIPHISLKWPWVSACKISCNAVEFHLPSLHRNQLGPVQTFNLKHIRTGFGIRQVFICQCGRPVLKLYVVNRYIACRRCSNARYASQTLDKRDRPVLQASRIAHFLDSKSKLYRRTRERLRKRLGDKLMMAQGQLGTEARGFWE